MGPATTDDSSFELLETLRWTPDEGFYLLNRHLSRLEASARHFGFRCRLHDVRGVLQGVSATAERPTKVRVLVSRDGTVRVERAPIDPTPTPLRVGLAARPINPANPFLFHKTTDRTEQERERSPDYDEMVLWNPDRDITEAMAANIVVDLGNRSATPPAECGLLAGTMRAELLARGEICEERISIDQLVRAPRFWLINSVRGSQPAILAR